MRIHVTGNAGAGKTTLGKKIGRQFDLPVFGLDKIVWQPGWIKTDPAARDQLEADLIAQPDWVIEGVSHVIRRAADVTVFLDLPRHRCLARALKRSLPHLFESRPELPNNCPEYKILPQLATIIWRFEQRVKPVIVEDINAGYPILQMKDPDQFDADALRRFFH